MDKLTILTRILDKLMSREIGTVFEEIGADDPEDVSLDKIKPDRRELDKIIMGDILGLTEEEQLEVYRAVVRLVRERIERAKSVRRKRKKKTKVDLEALANDILSEIDFDKLKGFPDKFLRESLFECEVIEVKSGIPKLVIDLTGAYIDVGGDRIKFDTPDKARYIYYAMLNGHSRIKIPKDPFRIKEIVEYYSKLYKSIRTKIKEEIEKRIPDKKTREKILIIVENKLTKKLREGSS